MRHVETVFIAEDFAGITAVGATGPMARAALMDSLLDIGIDTTEAMDRVAEAAISEVTARGCGTSKTEENNNCGVDLLYVYPGELVAQRYRDNSDSARAMVGKEHLLAQLAFKLRDQRDGLREQVEEHRQSEAELQGQLREFLSAIDKAKKGA